MIKEKQHKHFWAIKCRHFMLINCGPDILNDINDHIFMAVRIKSRYKVNTEVAKM